MPAAYRLRATAAALCACALISVGALASDDIDDGVYVRTEREVGEEGTPIEFEVDAAGFPLDEGELGGGGEDVGAGVRVHTVDDHLFHCIACGGEMEGALSPECSKARNAYVARTCVECRLPRADGVQCMPPRVGRR